MDFRQVELSEVQISDAYWTSVKMKKIRLPDARLLEVVQDPKVSMNCHKHKLLEIGQKGGTHI